MEERPKKKVRFAEPEMNDTKEYLVMYQFLRSVYPGEPTVELPIIEENPPWGEVYGVYTQDSISIVRRPRRKEWHPLNYVRNTPPGPQLVQPPDTILPVVWYNSANHETFTLVPCDGEWEVVGHRPILRGIDLPPLADDTEPRDPTALDTQFIRPQVLAATPTTQSKYSGIGRPIVCRTVVTIGDGPSSILACIDTGATFTLLASSVYDALKGHSGVGEIEPGSMNLVGASGTALKMRGTCLLTFAIHPTPDSVKQRYTHEVQVGELKGVDLLLGMDWLHVANADVSCGRMTVTLGHRTRIQLETDPTIRSTAKIFKVTGKANPGEADQSFIRSFGRQLITSGHTERVRVKTDGRWPANKPAVFECSVNLGEGIYLEEQLVQPGEIDAEFCIAIANTTVTDLVIESGTLLGQLVELKDLREEADVAFTSLPDNKPCFAIWNIAAQVGSPIDPAMEAIPGEIPEEVDGTFHLDQEGGSPIGPQQPFKSTQVRQVIGRKEQKAWTCPASAALMHLVRLEDIKEQQSGRPGSTRRDAGQQYQEDMVAYSTRTWSAVESSESMETSLNFEEQQSADPSGTESTQTQTDEVRLGEDDEHIAVGRDASQPEPAILTRPEHPTMHLFTTGAAPSGVSPPSTSPTPHVVGYRWEEKRLIQTLPEHLRCMLPPPGVLQIPQFASAVALVKRYEDIFCGADGKVGRTDRIQHRIDTGEREPVKVSYGKKSPAEKDEITSTVAKLLREGQIKPSKSPWGAPVVLVKKKDGTLRFCIDFRQLNDATKKDAYPLPKIEECLDCLGGNKFFHTLDLASGYWQVEMHPDDREKTAFSTPIGLFEWIVMPFGLCNAPATFCRLMEMVLSDILWTNCLVYLDDVITYGKTFQTAIENLELVFDRLRAANLTLKPKKCELFRTEVEYLGHEVTQEGIRPCEKKVKVLEDWKLPKTVTEVRAFLGFCSYYRKFVDNFSAIAQPLTALTRKDVIFPEQLSPECVNAFRELCCRLAARVRLHFVERGAPFILDTDASQYAIGAVLSQVVDGEERPLAFASKTLNTSRQRYCTTKRELYAIVYFMRYFSGYTRFQQVLIRSDHACLKWLKAFKSGDPMYFRWIAELSSHGEWIQITYREGKEHTNADAMSRLNEGIPRHESVYGAAHRDCTYGKCIQCRVQFKAKRELAKLVDSESDSDQEDPGNSSDRGPPGGGAGKGKDPEWGYGDDDTLKGDRPDRGDYATWELALTRAQATGQPGRKAPELRHMQEHDGLPRVLRSKSKRRPRKVYTPTPGRYALRPRQEKGGEKPESSPSSPSTNGTTPKKKSNRSQAKKRRDAHQKCNLRRKKRLARRKLKKATEQRADPDSGVDTESDSDGTSDPKDGRKWAQDRRVPPSRRAKLPSQGRNHSPLSAKGHGDRVATSGDGLAKDKPCCDLPSDPEDDQGFEEETDSADRQGKDGVTEKEDISAQLDFDIDPHWPLAEPIDDARWIELQNEDLVLSRVKGLMKEYGDRKPDRNVLKAEIREVRSICKHWETLVIGKDGILCRRFHSQMCPSLTPILYQRFVPSSLRVSIFLRIHGEDCGHLGYEKIYPLMVARFYWWNMSQDILEWTRACKSCQKSKTGKGLGKMPMKIDAVGSPMMRVGMDLQGPFPTSSSGMVYILVIQDYFSKWVELFAIPDKTAETVAEVLVKEYFTRWGTCKRLHSDQGKEFDAALTKQLCRVWNVRKTRTTPFAPWSNGMVERSNKTIKAILRQVCDKDYKRTWDTRLPFVRMAINNTVHATTGFTPYKLFLSRCEDARLPCDLLYGQPELYHGECYHEYIELQKVACQEIAEVARKHIGKQMLNQRANKARGGLRMRDYKVGDYVWRLWKPFLTDKLHSSPWTGPYKVYQVGPQGYTVLLWVPKAGGGFGYKWIHTSSVKPAVFAREGRMMTAITPDTVEEAVLVWTRQVAT